MYFRRFPAILYNFDIQPTGDPTLKSITDITTNVRLRKVILENITLFDEYDIIEGETPETIADKIYGSAEYHWVIMLCNQRYDYIEDFPLSYQAFNRYVTEKYGNSLFDIHHYEKDGFIVESSVVGAQPVTNYDYEDKLNEQKRRIKLISPQLMGRILSEFKDLI